MKYLFIVIIIVAVALILIYFLKRKRLFLEDFKRKTEEIWENKVINPTLYGFQFQQGTKWNPGLTSAQIKEYEKFTKSKFPDDFRKMLLYMNGTNLQTVNIYGSDGTPQKESVGVYSYPRDKNIISEMISYIENDRDKIEKELADQDFILNKTDVLVPIYIHRYIVCTKDKSKSVVLSIYGTDAIVYGYSLKEYLEKEFL